MVGFLHLKLEIFIWILNLLSCIKKISSFSPQLFAMVFAMCLFRGIQ